MKCSSRSTTWRGSAAARALVALAVALATVAAPAAVAPDDVAVGAIEHAVKSILGLETTVSVSDLHVAWHGDAASNAPLEARPEPGVRIGRAMRFSLWRRTDAGVRNAGYATGVVDVS